MKKILAKGQRINEGTKIVTHTHTEPREEPENGTNCANMSHTHLQSVIT